METDQVEQLHTFVSQSAKALNKHQDTGEKDASITSKWENRSPFSFDNQDTQTEVGNGWVKGHWFEFILKPIYSNRK